MKKIILLSLLLLPLLTWGQTDEFEAFRKQIKREMQITDSIYRHDFNRFRDSLTQVFATFRDSINREFARFLQQPWKTHPIIQPEKATRYEYGIPRKRILSIHHTRNSRSPKSFFGLPINTSLPAGIPSGITKISEKIIGKIWLSLGELDFSASLAECLLLSSLHNLNSWGYYQLTVFLTEQLPVSPATRIVTQCFLMNHAGYKCRIGAIEEEELVLLIPFNIPVYNFCCVMLDNTPYYIPEKRIFPSDKLKTYAKEIQFATRTPDLFLHAPLKLGNDRITRKEFTSHKGNILVPVNENLIDFYATYPTCDLPVYASAPVDSLSLGALRKIVTSDTSDHANICEILHFIQTNFKNQPDSLMWGQERYFFTEESLYYSALDCEDSAILFRQLVNRLTLLEAVLVVYPQHVAAAVNLPITGTGKQIIHNNKKYTLCEPSCIGASPGTPMPCMEGIKELFCY